MTDNKKEKSIKVDAKLEPFEELDTEKGNVTTYPYTYNHETKQIICAPGTIFANLRELKDEQNRDEERMRAVHVGISRVS